MALPDSIRLNVALRMFDISADKAALILWSKGHQIQARPTVKITSEQFVILYDELKLQGHFKGQTERTAEKFYDNYNNSLGKIDLEQTSSTSNTVFKKRRVRARSNNENKRDLSRIHAYVENEKCKIIAKLKWYYNRQTNGEYGFLTCSGLPDIRFSGGSVIDANPHQLSEGQELVVTIKKRELEKYSDLKAIQVNLVADENNLLFLVHLAFSTPWSSLIAMENHNKLDEAIEKLDLNDKTTLQERIKRALGELESIELNQAIFVHQIADKAKLGLLNTIEMAILDKLGEGNHFRFWLRCNTQIAFASIESDAMKFMTQNFTEWNIVLDKVDKRNKEFILNTIVEEILRKNENIVKEDLVTLVSNFELNGCTFPFEKLNPVQLLELWLSGNLNQFPVDAIFDSIRTGYNLILGFQKNNDSENERKINSLKAYFNKIFAKTTEEERKKINSKFLYESQNDDDSFNLFLFLLDYLPIDATKAHLVSQFYTNFSDYHRLKLFVLDHTEEIDYHSVVIYTALLKSEEQKLFFKKVLKLKMEGGLNLSLQDLNKITSIDYQTSEYARMIDGSQLDFSVSVIVRLMNDLSQGVITKRNTIFELVARQIKRPEDLLVIDGFFEECEGRTVLAWDKIQDSDGESEYSYHKLFRSDDKPRFSNYCAGRKALIRNTGEPSLCNKSGFEFWWCENRQCYDLARKKHSTDDWKNYTLEDALRILDIPHQESQYEILLGVINRVNRFLKHLTCRKCEKILKPKGKSNYAFFNVTTFSCQDAECTEHGKQIYLSHCSNGRCEDIIDSRDCVKCKPKGFGPECGWYICKSCNSCCSSENLARRKYIKEQTGQEYKCHINGHKDQGIKCCSSCGEEMTRTKNSQEVYLNQLNWFIENKEKHPHVSNYGQRQGDNKWWFIWSQGKYDYKQYRRQLKGMRNSGFNVPDYDVLEKVNQLVAEPIQWAAFEIHECPGCGNSLETRIGN